MSVMNETAMTYCSIVYFTEKLTGEVAGIWYLVWRLGGVRTRFYYGLTDSVTGLNEIPHQDCRNRYVSKLESERVLLSLCLDHFHFLIPPSGAILG